MGATVSRLAGRGRQQTKVAMLGLDAVGKTTLLYRLQLGRVETVTSTIGFNQEEIDCNGLALTMYDVGGGSEIYNVWHYYVEGAAAVVFVVDSTDPERLDDAREKLRHLLDHEAMQNDLPLLVLANKQDIPGAFDAEKVIKELDLRSVKRHPWHVQEVSAVTGQGLDKALEWLGIAVEGYKGNVASTATKIATTSNTGEKKR